jgi:hypothetical protein
MRQELPEILEAAGRHELRIVWVCISDCLWQQTAIGDIQAAHDPSRPLDALGKAKRSKVLQAVANILIDSVSSPPRILILHDCDKCIRQVSETLGNIGLDSEKNLTVIRRYADLQGVLTSRVQFDLIVRKALLTDESSRIVTPKVSWCQLQGSLRGLGRVITLVDGTYHYAAEPNERCIGTIAGVLDANEFLAAVKECLSAF